ncbi:hypothetical protein MNBD_NITROSPINAE04-2619 [hydrothermal vent metagenome]|uniref:Putative regulatory protein FmdB zinc ribbon domain-containing protein n=1 Tax=hydrothermal vent metagenome TaxID=652676 RepID=A0A3B1BDT6_9ZZZZ
MPIYEYSCAKCGKVLEVTQKMSDPPLKRHNGASPRCGGKLSKLMSANSFHLKGTGWYKTDYAKKEEKPKAKAKSESKKKESSTKKESTAKSADA